MSIRSIFRKSDDEQRVMFGEVYAPGVPDSQGDYMTSASQSANTWPQ